MRGIHFMFHGGDTYENSSMEVHARKLFVKRCKWNWHLAILCLLPPKKQSLQQPQSPEWKEAWGWNCTSLRQFWTQQRLTSPEQLRQKQALSPKYTVGFHFPRMQSSQTTFLSAPIKGNGNTQGLCITNSQQRNKSICTTQTAPAKPQQCGFTKCKHRIAIRGESHATNSSGNNYSNILDHLLKNVFQEETFLTGRPCGVSRLKIKRNGTHIRKKFSRTKNSQPHIIHLKWTLTVDWTSSTCNENTWYKRTLFEKCCAAQNKHPAVIAHPL